MIDDPNQWDFGRYKGYHLMRVPRAPGCDDTVAAYGGTFPHMPWFEGETPEQVKEEIDLALADVPPPVY